MYEIMTEESKKRLNVLKGELSKKGVSMETEVKFGNAADTIISAAKEKGADMIVVGSYGRHGAKNTFGQCILKVVEHAACDVLVVK